MFTLAVAGLLVCDTPASAETSLTTLRGQTRELLRAEAEAQPPQKDEAIAALCDLYVVVRSDSRYGGSTMLQGDAAKIRRRLLTVAKRRTAELKRQGIARPEQLSQEISAAIEAATSRQESSGELPAVEGGDLQGLAAGGGALDDGWRLVELIQRVVEPDFWNDRGGPGAIHYFALRRVLVVRATSDVHQQVRDLLMALR